ncbi:MAG TPA: DUF6216 family protein [Pseudomonas sp.]|jgi:hypothetical protein
MSTALSADTSFDWFITNPTSIIVFLNLLLLAAGFVYIYRRAKSMLFLRDRLWRLLGGKADFAHEKFERMKREARELEHFRYEFNIPAHSLEQAEAFHEWQSQHRLQLGDVSLAKNYIDWRDFNALKMKVSLRQLRRINVAAMIAAILLYLVVALSFSLAASNYLMVSFKDTPFFYVSEKDVKFSPFGQPKLSSQTCESPEALQALDDETDFPPQRFSSICEEFGSPRIVEHIKTELSKQRIMLVSLGSMLFVFFLALVKAAVQRRAAKRLLEQLERTASSSNAH